MVIGANKTTLSALFTQKSQFFKTLGKPWILNCLLNRHPLVGIRVKKVLNKLSAMICMAVL